MDQATKNKRLRSTVLAGLAMLACIGAFALGRAGAEGIPSKDPLFYSGTLIDNGVPMNGLRTIIVTLWDDEQSTDVAHRRCQSSSPAMMVTNGRFRVPLDPACVTAFQQNRDLWAQVFVDATTMARQKVGAVPYALQAAHAADVPSWAYTPSSLVTRTTVAFRD